MADSGHGAGDEERTALDVFISYRREDTEDAAGRLSDVLSPRFGVFMDVDGIPLGVDFAEEIARRVESCDVLIALLGKQWLTLGDETGRRRLDSTEDFVRIEIEAALQRGVPVIPAFVQGVRMPRATDLPASLKPFARRNGIELRHAAWRSDVDRLVKALERLVQEKATPQSAKRAAVEKLAKPSAPKEDRAKEPTKRVATKQQAPTRTTKQDAGDDVVVVGARVAAKPRSTASKPTAAKPATRKRASTGPAAGESKRNTLQAARRRFGTEIKRRGFTNPTGFNTYYQGDDWWSQLRIVLKDSRIRLERRVRVTEYELWRSFSVLDEIDSALNVLDNLPKRLRPR